MGTQPSHNYKKIIYICLLIGIVIFCLIQFKSDPKPKTVNEPSPELNPIKPQIISNLTEEQTKRIESIVDKISIEDIILDQIENGVNVAFTVQGVHEGRFEIVLQVVVDGNVKANLIEKRNEMALVVKNQKFNIPIFFEQLSEVYGKAIGSKLEGVSEPFEVDEFLLITAKIQLIEIEDISRDDLIDLDFTSSSKSVIMRLLFVCQQDGCRVVQKDAINEEEIKPTIEGTIDQGEIQGVQ